ncbi:hypothetical protein PP914_gp133 [Arthrobacter phage Qui]|jgi:hypothetical protein|uniref:Uncharacterized protein n=1 Tax=Arthrobacter phage Qui TaxID=2603260 RepID=A0A5B8WLY8_9CAUD|nr:hypothetical protein PP914_gp133 [Arthrobacter phage Qui]QED11622.1 hypothetical protein SEA_QUI_133 [Arthrobacter phage Qui]
MKKYRAKPHVVEAQQFKGGIIDATPILNWINTNGGKGVWCGATRSHVKNSERRITSPGLPETLRIRTRNGWELIQVGDYVVRNEQGEFEPCPSAIFERDYESSLADVVSIIPTTKEWNNIA